LITPVILVLLFFGGFCDLFPIINDHMGEMDDNQNSASAQWVLANSQPQATFLNLSSNFDFVMLTGRKIYLGVPYFNWSLGYPEQQRTDEIKKLITDNFPKAEFCDYMQTNKINFFYDNPGEKKVIDMDFDPEVITKNFGSGIQLEGLHMYSTDNTCNR
jgi:hypothetical protein